jgi:N-lysine methyltransferase SETD6
MTDSSEATSSDDFSQRSAEFLQWFQNSPHTRLNAKVRLADLRHRQAGRGAGRLPLSCLTFYDLTPPPVASADIDTDEELFAIPRDVVLTASTSTIPEKILEPIQDLGSWSLLIVCIIYEYLRAESSPWHPYFRVLPTSFHTLMFWNDADLAYLQASAVVDKIGKASAEESWKETIVPFMLEHPNQFPVEGETEAAKTSELIRLAHFAGSLIMAYAFDIDRDDEERQNGATSDDEDFEEDDEDEPLKGMVPMADMLNADADRNNVGIHCT